MKSLCPLGSQPHFEPALPEPDPEPAAPGDRGQPLLHLVGVGLRVQLGVQERPQPPEPVLRAGQQDQRGHAEQADHEHAQEDPQPHSGRPQQTDEQHEQADHRAEVVVAHGHEQQPGHREQRPRQVPEHRGLLALAHQHVGRPHGQRELGQLAGLQLQRAEVEPQLVGPQRTERRVGQHVGVGQQGEDVQRAHEQEGQQQPGAGQHPPGVHRQPLAQPERDQAHGGGDGLPLHRGDRAAALTELGHAGG